MRCGLNLELTFAFKLKYAGSTDTIAEIAMITFCVYIGWAKLPRLASRLYIEKTTAEVKSCGFLCVILNDGL